MVTMELLRKIPVFKGIDDGPLRDMSHICKRREYGPGEIIFRQNDPATMICYLVRGGVDIRMNEDHIPSDFGGVVAKVEPDECFGWSALVAPNIFTASAVACEASEVLVIDGPGLEAYMRSNGDLCFSVFENLARTISERLASTRLKLLAARGPVTSPEAIPMRMRT